MINRVTGKDIVWGYLAQFLNVGAGAILIPVAIACLSAEDMGLWYVFIALAGLAQLLEFGFQPTISRLTAYVYSGAKDLKAQGLPESTSAEVNLQLLFDLISASKALYMYVAFSTAITFLLLGTLYIYSLGVTDLYKYLAWVVFSVSSIVNFYFTYFNGLLQGRGEQTVLNKTIAQSKAVLLLVALPLLMLDFGLLSMSIATFISMAFNRYLIYIKFYDEKRKETQFFKIAEVERNMTSLLLASSWRLGLTQFGAFLIQRGNIFIVSSFLGLKVAASFGLTLQLLNLISSVSGMIFNLNLPRLNAYQSKNNKSELRHLFSKSLKISWLLFVVGVLGLVIAGGPILALLSKGTMLVSFPLLVLMAISQLLEMNHSLCATYLTTMNYVPFVKAALISGVSITCLSLLGVNYTSNGLLAVVMSQGVVQLTYNNWHWPLVVYKHLREK